MDFVLYAYVVGLVLAIMSAATGELGALIAAFMFVMVANIVERWKR